MADCLSRKDYRANGKQAICQSRHSRHLAPSASGGRQRKWTELFSCFGISLTLQNNIFSNEQT